MHSRPPTPISGRRGGFAFIAVLAVLVLLSTLVVAAYATALADFRSGSMDVGKSRSLYAAEAGGESAMAQLAVALEDAVLEGSELDMIAAPTLTGFAFDSFTVRKVGGVEHERITDGPFTGLYALTQRVEIYSEASDRNRSSSAVLVTAKAQAIPIFQFGVFYDRDLEIHNGPPMTFSGWVHSNGNIYLSSDHAYFEDLITTPRKIFHDRKAYHEVKHGVYIHDASATDVQLAFDSRSVTDADAFRSRSDTDFDGRLRTDAHEVDSLRVPLPDAVDPVEVQRPRDIDDGSLEIQAKFAHKADWYIEVPLDHLSDPADLCAEMIHVRDGGEPLPTLAECQNIFRLEYEAFYDGREGRFVDVVEVDLARFFNWTGADPARESRILYLFTSGTGPDPSGDGSFPVVRLVNGQTLGNPFTFATQHPLYTRGPYNTGLWQPASVVGDALTILSPLWDDAQQQGPVQRNATGMGFFAAILMGHSGSPCDHEEPGCVSSGYGGGLENFPRFLEDWGGDVLTYRGSLVSLHFSRFATAAWGCCTYYTPPTRDWEFDIRFEDPANLPPGTPVVGNVIHTAFRPVF